MLPSDIPYSERFNTMSYSSGYILALMLSPLLLMLFGTFKCFIDYLLSKLHKNSEKKKKYAASAGQIYGFWLRMLFELSLDISIIGLLEITMQQTTYKWEKISFCISFLLFNIMVFGGFFTVNLIKSNVNKI